jgi:chlorophyllide a reductase subunit X
LFELLSDNVAQAQPVLPEPLSQDALLGLFDASAVGRDVVLEAASSADMMGKNHVERPSLEVIYEAA